MARYPQFRIHNSSFGEALTVFQIVFVVGSTLRTLWVLGVDEVIADHVMVTMVMTHNNDDIKIV